MKEKTKKISPMQRSLKLLRESGWICAIVEKYNPFAKVRQDLFGFGDILALRQGEMLAVQTTTKENVLARKKKIKENPNCELLKSAGCNGHIHGWSKSKSGWECKIIQL